MQTDLSNHWYHSPDISSSWKIRDGLPGASCSVYNSNLPASPSPALFYLRDTRLLGPNTPVSPGSVPMMISSSPLGAVNRPKDGPLVTVTVPVQSGLIV